MSLLPVIYGDEPAIYNTISGYLHYPACTHLVEVLGSTVLRFNVRSSAAYPGRWTYIFPSCMHPPIFLRINLIVFRGRELLRPRFKAQSMF